MMRSNVLFRVAISSMCLALAAIAAVPSSSAQAWAKAALDSSPRHGEFVTITEPSGRKLQAWVVYPESKDKAAAVVMIHEIFGLSDWAREMADQVAASGYIVVEPDLLSGLAAPASASTSQGKTAAGADAPMDHASLEAAMNAGGAPYVTAQPGGTSAFPDQSAVIKAVSSLPDAQVLGDLDAAADYAKNLAASNGKLNVAGFCWGGGKSFLFATHRQDLSAAFVFYGPPPSAAAMKSITAPVYGFYAGDDARISATVPQTVQDMKAAGKVYEPVIYPGAGHGFMRAGEAPDASTANAAAQKQGFERFMTLLATHQ
jgi:carboxymethylenebutenolidase